MRIDSEVSALLGVNSHIGEVQLVMRAFDELEVLPPPTTTSRQHAHQVVTVHVLRAVGATAQRSTVRGRPCER